MIRAGDTVRCIDNTSRGHWAEWYGDDAYSEDMLQLGTRYLVRDVRTRDGETGLDIGIPTPWGDQFWNADRFEKALLRLPINVAEQASTLLRDNPPLGRFAVEALEVISGADPALVNSAPSGLRPAGFDRGEGDGQ